MAMITGPTLLLHSLRNSRWDVAIVAVSDGEVEAAMRTAPKVSAVDSAVAAAVDACSDMET